MLKTPNAYLQCFAIKTAVVFFERERPKVPCEQVLEQISYQIVTEQ